jgi:hypothetical protein
MLAMDEHGGHQELCGSGHRSIILSVRTKNYVVRTKNYMVGTKNYIVLQCAIQALAWLLVALDSV